VLATGLVFSIYLTWLELFVIRAICQWCVVSAILVLCMFILAILDYRELNMQAGTTADDTATPA